MSTYSARRPIRKRRDYMGIFIFLIVLILLPAVGYVGYLMVTDPAKLEALGLKQIDARTGQPIQPKNAPTTPPDSALPPATTVAATETKTPSKTPSTANGGSSAPASSSPAQKTGPANGSDGMNGPEDNTLAKVDPPAPVKPGDVAPPVRGPGKPTSVAQAVEHIGASIAEALGIPRKVLVVWLVDESNSNADYRRDLRDAVEKLYAGLKQTKPDDGASPDDAPLLSVVAPFGQQVSFSPPEPTADPGEVKRAIADIVDADNGVENTILAVEQSLEKFLTYRTQKNRHLMFVIVSDEVGDDQAKVDKVLPKLKQYTIPVYTVGVVAPFGSTGETMKLTPQGGGIIGTPDPSSAKGDFKVVYGPDSRDVDWLKLDYPDGSGDGDLGDLELGPYTLSRLCAETGGEYFALRTRRYDMVMSSPSTPKIAVERGNDGPGRSDSYFAALAGMSNADRPLPKFDDAVVMLPPETTNSGAGMSRPTPPNFKKYAPAYLSEAEYQKSIAGNKAKQALLEVAKMQGVPALPSNVRTTIDTSDEVRKTQSILQAQRPAALVQPLIDPVYEALRKGEADSAKLTEPRWKAAYDLAYGRISAAKARADSYMSQLAAIRNGKEATGLQPSDEPIKNSAIDKMAATARERLQRVAAEHPGTPWAKAAERELRTPMSWKLVE